MSVSLEAKGHVSRAGPMPAAAVGGDYDAGQIAKACLNLIAKTNEADDENRRLSNHWTRQSHSV